MIYDIVPPAILAQRYQIKRWVKTLNNRGEIRDGRAVLLMVNWRYPELSYFIADIYET